MATTKNYYTGDGTTTAFTFTFPYLNTSHIKIKLDGVVSETTEYTLTPTSNPTTVNFNTAPANNVSIEIYRDTNITTANNVFAAGSSLKAASLNDGEYNYSEKSRDKYLKDLLIEQPPKPGQQPPKKSPTGGGEEETEKNFHQIDPTKKKRRRGKGTRRKNKKKGSEKRSTKTYGCCLTAS